MLRLPRRFGIALVAGAFVMPGSAAAATTSTTPTNATSPARTPTTRTTQPHDLDPTKQRCIAAIDTRLTELTKLAGRVAAAKTVTDSHRSALTSINTAAQNGLADLKSKITADTDAATLKKDCDSVVSGFRIFALRSPQENLVIASDAETAAIAKLQGVVPTLSAAVDKVAAAGTDVTAARQALADLTAKLEDASRAVTGLGDRVVGMQPADYNANQSLLAPARAAVKAAAADLKAARGDVKAIANTLKATTAKAPR